MFLFYLRFEGTGFLGWAATTKRAQMTKQCFVVWTYHHLRNRITTTRAATGRTGRVWREKRGHNGGGGGRWLWMRWGIFRIIRVDFVFSRWHILIIISV